MKDEIIIEGVKYKKVGEETLIFKGLFDTVFIVEHDGSSIELSVKGNITSFSIKGSLPALEKAVMKAKELRGEI